MRAFGSAEGPQYDRWDSEGQVSRANKTCQGEGNTVDERERNA